MSDERLPNELRSRLNWEKAAIFSAGMVAFTRIKHPELEARGMDKPEWFLRDTVRRSILEGGLCRLLKKLAKHEEAGVTNSNIKSVKESLADCFN